MPTLLQGARMNPNRLVAVLTPLVFAPLAGAIAAGVAKYGIDVDDGQLQAIFIAGATIALAKSAQWTKGWQAFEQRQAAAAADPIAFDDDLPGDEAEAGADAGAAAPDFALDEPDVDLAPDLDDDPRPDDDDLDDDMDEDFEAEAAELLAGHGS
jgi:hypothetical protein